MADGAGRIEHFAAPLKESQNPVVKRLKSALNFLLVYRVITANSFFFFLTGALEQLMETATPNCPCDGLTAQWYSAGFVFGPFLVLLALGILAKRSTWLFYQGYCNRDKRYREGGCGTCIKIFAEAVVIPLGWLIFALLDGDYYACFFSGTYTPPCDDEKDRKHLKELKLESAVAGWVLVGVVTLIAFVGLCCARCHSRNTFYQKKYKDVYKEKQVSVIVENMKKNVEVEVPKDMALFLQAHKFTQTDWELVARDEPAAYLEMERAISDRWKGAASSISGPQAWFERLNSFHSAESAPKSESAALITEVPETQERNELSVAKNGEETKK